jgi:hypothetical protein
MLYPGFVKSERIANVVSEIQIVDTPESLKNRFNIGFATSTSPFNRTLLIPHHPLPAEPDFDRSHAPASRIVQHGRKTVGAH